MSALGRHVLAEFYGCPPEMLNDLAQIKPRDGGSGSEAGAEVRETVFTSSALRESACSSDL